MNSNEQNLSSTVDNNVCLIPPIRVMPGVFLSVTKKNVDLKKKKDLKPSVEKIPSSPSPEKTAVNAPKEKLVHPAVFVLGAFLLIGIGAVIAYLLFATPKQEDKNITPSVTPPVVPPVVKPVVVTPPPKKPVEITLLSYPSTTDTDLDFLTDIEESLYGTSVNNKDQDEDGYPDGLELISSYSPIAKKPARLEDSGLISVFNNSKQGYSIFYPKTWSIRMLNADQSDVSFNSSTAEFVEMIVVENSQEETLMNWMKRQYPNIDIASLEQVGISDVLGVKSPNGLRVSFINNNKIYSIIYQIGTLRQLNFKATFQMMYNSLRLFSRAGEQVSLAENWSFYTNNILGVSFQHPATVTPEANNEAGTITVDGFSLLFIDNPEKLTLDSWIEKKYLNKDENKDCVSRASDFSVGKLPTFLLEKNSSQTDGFCQDGGYYTINNDQTRIIKLSLSDNLIKETTQILSTLILTEKSSPAPVINDSTVQ